MVCWCSVLIPLPARSFPPVKKKLIAHLFQLVQTKTIRMATRAMMKARQKEKKEKNLKRSRMKEKDSPDTCSSGTYFIHLTTDWLYWLKNIIIILIPLRVTEQELMVLQEHGLPELTLYMKVVT